MASMNDSLEFPILKQDKNESHNHLQLSFHL